MQDGDLDAPVGVPCVQKRMTKDVRGSARGEEAELTADRLGKRIKERRATAAMIYNR